MKDDDSRRGDVFGTAFLVASKMWVTAAHVVAGCATNFVRVRGQWKPARDTRQNNAANLAVIRTEDSEHIPAVGVTDRIPVIDQEDFHFGFPQGVPSAVYTRFLVSLASGPRSLARLWCQAGFGLRSRGNLNHTSHSRAFRAVLKLIERVPHRASRSCSRTGLVVSISFLGDLVLGAVSRIPDGGANIGSTDFGRNGDQVRGVGAVTGIYCSLAGKTRPHN